MDYTGRLITYMINKIKNVRIINILIAWLVCFAIFNLGGFSASDILLGAMMVISLAVLENGKLRGLNLSDRVRRSSIVLTLIITILYILYIGEGITSGLENKLFKLIFFVATSIGVFCVFYLAIRYILVNLVNAHDCEWEISCKGFNFKIWLVFSGLIFLCMLPLFFLNFPATMTVDSFDQLSQAMSLEPYSDHHPWAHTLIIKLMYSIGYSISGNVTVAIAAYTLFQMIVLAISLGYSIASMEEMGFSRKWQYFIFFAFVIYPYNLAYAITMWKDILFSASVLILTITIYRLVMLDNRKNISIRDWILFVIGGLFMCLLRHNGLYAFLISAFVILLWLFFKSKTLFIPGLISYLLILSLVIIIKGPIQSYNGVKKGDYAHNLAIPLQQIGRVVSYNGDISPEEIKELEKINSIIYIKNNYTAGGADNMIQWLAAGESSYFEENKDLYFKLWLSLGIKNPKAYLEAFFEQTKGYYTCMMSEQIAYYGIMPNNMKLDNHPLFGATKRIKINEILSKLQDVIPVYGIMYSTGAVFQLILVAIGVEICKGRKKMLLVYLPILMLLATVIVATPLVADLRYGYTLLLSFPTLLAMTLGKNSAVK